MADQFIDGHRTRILIVVDDCSTSISGNRVGCELDRLLAERGKPKTIVSDNGGELTSNAILRRADDQLWQCRYSRSITASAASRNAPLLDQFSFGCRLLNRSRYSPCLGQFRRAAMHPSQREVGRASKRSEGLRLLALASSNIRNREMDDAGRKPAEELTASQCAEIEDAELFVLNSKEYTSGA